MEVLVCALFSPSLKNNRNLNSTVTRAAYVHALEALNGLDSESAGVADKSKQSIQRKPTQLEYLYDVELEGLVLCCPLAWLARYGMTELQCN